MRLRHIEVFHAVYTSGSITNAAKLLNVSQPSVSKVLAHAEQQLGFALFDRLKGKIVPTQEAERLISHVTDAYDNISELRRISENLCTSDSGLIRIAMIPAFGIELVPAAIASYLARHTDTRFEIETLHLHQVTRALKQSRVDIGMVFDPPATPGVHIESLVNTECVVVAHKSRDFGSKKKLAMKDLDGMPFIKLMTRSPLGSKLASHVDASGVKLRTVAKVETYQMAKALVAQNAGVSIIDEITARSTGHGDVVVWKLQQPLKVGVALMHIESEPLSILAQRFIQHLKSTASAFLEIKTVA